MRDHKPQRIEVGHLGELQELFPQISWEEYLRELAQPQVHFCSELCHYLGGVRVTWAVQVLPWPSMDKDSQDVHQVLNELKNKFQEMRKLISSMPGIGVSPEQQQQQLQNLREQVRTKNELLQKYKSLCMFEIPKE
ncbi:Mediator of RNA polymerase II transcription subunit 9 [Pitangus sulphuratus]|nr:Mediator of RNA polymerase II transcription subunit 9 [Pitangus sulphuratus]